MGLMALDTETTGVDLRHGAMPFFITLCDEEGNVDFREWKVCPTTRKPVIPQEDKDWLLSVLLDERQEWVMQNGRFDVKALSTLYPERPDFCDSWPWDRTQDTLIGTHVLESGLKHDLTSLATRYLQADISKHEKKLEECVKECRRQVQQARLRIKREATSTARKSKFAPGDYRNVLAEWRIADESLPEMPSAKGSGQKKKGDHETGSLWRYDSWLPNALADWYWMGSPAQIRWEELRPTWTPRKEVKGVADRIIAYQEAIEECSTLAGWQYRPIEDTDGDHPWRVYLRDYANHDSMTTMLVWKAMRRELKRRGYWDIYRVRMKIPCIATKLENRGVTYSGVRLSELTQEYRQESANARNTCLEIAKAHGFDLILPQSGVNNSLREFIYDGLRLEKVYPPKTKNKTGVLNPTLDAKNAMAYYFATLPPESEAYRFLRALSDKRLRDTALSFMKGYGRFAFCLGDDWYVISPSLNPTGTSTLRWSCKNPNEQNISKREGFNLRYCFGPVPGREWWSCDAENIELRIPAYKSGQREFIELFERPKDPPYFGSNHLLISHLLHTELFENCLSCAACKKEIKVKESHKPEENRFCECSVRVPINDGRIFKERYKATHYQRVKNGNFAVQYGAVDRADGMGTADRTYGIPGAQAMIAERFTQQDALNKQCIAFAEKHGYIETEPDKDVDPKRGYPLMCERTGFGRVKPTLPLNYYVQGTACWWMMMAMIRCQEQLDIWNKEVVRQGKDLREHGYFIVMQVHDELVFDFPKRAHPKKDPKRSNLARINIIRNLMARGGTGISVPTPVSAEYNEVSWDEGVKV